MQKEQDSSFIPFEKEYMKIVEVKNIVTGKEDKFTPTTKLLYKYMFDRHAFFKGLGKQFFDNQSDMAIAIGTTTRTIINCMDILLDLGLVTKFQTKTHKGMHSNCYTVYDIFDTEMFFTGMNGKSIGKNKKPAQDFSVKTKPKFAIVVGDDDPDCPF